MERKHQGGVVGPVILISLGVIFLLNNLGWLDWSVWWTVLRLWPVLLIGAGLDLLIGRRSAWGSLLVALLLLAVLAGAVWLDQTRPAGPSATAETIEQSLQGAQQARVEVSPGVGDLHIDSLEQAGLLASGQVDVSRDEQLVSQADLQGDTLDYTLATNKDHWGFWDSGAFNRTWVVSLTPEIPIDLTVRTGMGSAEIDLSKLTISDLVVDTGLGRTVVTLPASGEFSARIEGGMGLLVVRIPEGVQARIRAHGGLAPISASPAFEREGDLYVTPDYADPSGQFDLQVELGIGSLQLVIISAD